MFYRLLTIFAPDIYLHHRHTPTVSVFNPYYCLKNEPPFLFHTNHLPTKEAPLTCHRYGLIMSRNLFGKIVEKRSA